MLNIMVTSKIQNNIRLDANKSHKMLYFVYSKHFYINIQGLEER